MGNSEVYTIKGIKIHERQLVFGLLVAYLILSVVWHFSTNAPWDDDCVGRYYDVKSAISNPRVFISLWDRPLFVLLFFLPFKLIGQEGILLMVIISALSAYALYQVAKELKMSNAYLVIPMFLFQAFFFTISRSALAEPLAAA